MAQLHRVQELVKDAKEMEKLCTESERQASIIAEGLLCKALDKKFGNYMTSSADSEKFVDDAVSKIFDMLDKHINHKKNSSQNSKYNQIEAFSTEIESLERKIMIVKQMLSNYSYIEKQQILRQIHLEPLPKVVDRIISENTAVELK